MRWQRFKVRASQRYGGNRVGARGGEECTQPYHYEERQGGGRAVDVQLSTLTSTQMRLRLTDVDHVCGSTCSP